jgi:hypothetical protein
VDFRPCPATYRDLNLPIEAVDRLDSEESPG